MKRIIARSTNALGNSRLIVGTILLIVVASLSQAQNAAPPVSPIFTDDIPSPSDLVIPDAISDSESNEVLIDGEAVVRQESVLATESKAPQKTKFVDLTSPSAIKHETLESILSVDSLAFESPVPSDSQTTACNEQSYEVFEVSTRHVGCNVCNLQLNNAIFDVNRFDDNQCTWKKTELLSAIHGKATAEVSNAITIFYAHGNWMDRNNARNRARIIANCITKTTCRPFRLVMLSWPSTRMRRPIKDIYNHSQCADKEAFYMAYLMRKCQPEQQIGLLGFSLGARIIGGGLHLDAGGCLIGRKLVDFGLEDRSTLDPTEFRKYRVTVIAPAIDQSWLSRGNRFGRAMLETDRLVNLYNSRDPVLRRYFLSDLSRRPLAAGFAGFIGLGDPRTSQPLAQQPRVDQFDCRSYLRNTHDERSYFAKCPCIRKALLNLTWE